MARTVLDALQSLLPDSSKTTLRQLLANDRVRVNGAPERDAKRELAEDEHVSVAAKHEKLDARVKILFEDSDLIVIDKAAGLRTVPDDKIRHETAETFLSTFINGQAHHVHRLDRDTSGVLVFAKNTFTRDRLQEQFADHKPDRVYVVIVHGKLRESSGTFRSHLAEDRDMKVRSVTEGGKEAITHYRVVASGKRWSMVEATLETGRRNQIRVHFAEAGHPVVGDTMYGHGREDGFGRLALHAKTLSLVHPRSGEKMTFTAEIPKAFREAKL
ncbi:MAG TPA: RluA family pseudouridine synthase [Thermoanaerobaculia bacterium]|nr:RluA family pseudouridine synthase [Thermoanaerobaculia bacterium]